MRILVRIGAVVVLLASTLVLGGVPVATSSCIGPVIGVGTAPDQPMASPAAARVDRSTEVIVAGKWFFDGCSDAFVGGGRFAGRADPRPLETQTPTADVPLTLTQGSRTWTLATAEAGPEPDYAISWMVSIPADAVDGPAILSAQGTELPIIIIG